MNRRLCTRATCFIYIGLVSSLVFSQDPGDTRWQQLNSVLTAFAEAGPEDLGEAELAQFMRDRAEYAGRLADQFKVYMKDDRATHRAEAWDAWMDLLNFAASSSITRQKELDLAERESLGDPNLSLEHRITIRINQIGRTSDLKEAEKLIRKTRAEVKGIHATLSADTRGSDGQFPHTLFLLNIARHSDLQNALRLTREVIDETRPGNRVHEEAMRMMSQFDRIGQNLKLRFVDVKGNTIDLEAYRGKVVLLAYWATWCPPCVAGIPKLKALRQNYERSEFEVIGMSFDDDSMDLQRFIEKHELTWPQYFHEEGMNSPIILSLGKPTLPSYWLIDRSGVLRGIGGIVNIEKQLQHILVEEAEKAEPQPPLE